MAKIVTINAVATAPSSSSGTELAIGAIVVVAVIVVMYLSNRQKGSRRRKSS